MIESYYKVKSCTISIQDGDESGQTIHHFHAHIIPRNKGDLTTNDLIYTKLQIQIFEIFNKSINVNKKIIICLKNYIF